jgi:hypothetical protein
VCFSEIYPIRELANASSVIIAHFSLLKKGSVKMRLALIVLFWFTLFGKAFAHIGHFGQIADHGHTAAGIAIGLAGAIALINILKDRQKNSEELEEDEIQEV